MLYRKTSILIASLCILASCSSPFSSDTNEGPNRKKESYKSFESGKEFDLNFAETKYDDHSGILIKFIKLLQESRCPNDVMCVWVGNAEIELEVTVSGEKHSVKLNTYSDSKREEMVGGYKIILQQLLPYPESHKNPTPEKDYTATLLIEKADS